MKLNQVLSIEKGSKAEIESSITKLYQTLSKPALLNGFTKTYKPLDETGEVLPPERQRVQFVATEALKEQFKLFCEAIDLTAAKDWANCDAKADVTLLDGTVLYSQVPVTHLLYLEKKLTDLRTIIGKVPTLDEAEDWTFDDNTNTWRSLESTQHRTKKVQKVVVLHEPTKEHPAQTQLVSEDVTVGHWHTVKFSGALNGADKAKRLARVEEVLQAVKMARETANSVDASRRDVGEKILGYVLGDL